MWLRKDLEHQLGGCGQQPHVAKLVDDEQLNCRKIALEFEQAPFVACQLIVSRSARLSW